MYQTRIAPLYQTTMSVVLPAAIVTCALASPPAKGDWPQWGRTPQSDAFNGVGPDGGGVEWTLTLEDRVVTSPAVAGGSVYAGTDAGHFYKLDQNTGKKLYTWTSPYAKAYPGCLECLPKCKCPMIRSSPAIDTHGAAYFGSYDYNIYKVRL